MHWWNTNAEWHWLMMLGMAVFWVVIIIAIIVGIRYLMGASQRSGPSAPHSPEETLKQRYARGEIDKPEYEDRLKDLRK